LKGLDNEKANSNKLIFCCLLIHLNGYGDWSLGDYTISKRRYFDGFMDTKKEFNFSGRATDLIVAGIIIYGISSWLGNRKSAFMKAQDAEIGWIEKAREFYCNNAQLPPGRAFAKYKWYLSEIAYFLTKYPKNQKFRNDLKSVFEMSQDDSRLTLSEKQEIVDQFTNNYKFLLPEKKQ
jgi:hypothetical protein